MTAMTPASEAQREAGTPLDLEALKRLADTVYPHGEEWAMRFNRGVVLALIARVEAAEARVANAGQVSAVLCDQARAAGFGDGIEAAEKACDALAAKVPGNSERDADWQVGWQDGVMEAAAAIRALAAGGGKA